MPFGKPVLALGTLLLCTGFSPSAHAQFFQNTTGIASPAETITFSEHPLALGTVLTTQYSDLGVTFSGLFYDPQPIGAPTPNFSGQLALNFSPVLPGGLVNPFSLFFNTPQTEAAFAMVSNPGTSTFTALLNGVVVASTTAHTDLNPTNDFYGFSGITFNQIQINAGGFNHAGLIDNIQLGTTAVPEPGSLALLVGMSLSGAGFLARRRKKAR